MLLEQVGFKQQYLKRQLLGSGGFARCYLMINKKTQEKLAGKVIRRRELKDKESREKIMQQIQIHALTNHQHVVKLVQTFEWEGEFYIMLELCQNNSLKELLKARVRLTQFQTRYYLLQLIDGLSYLHSIGIVHRDIKLGNIFLNNKMQIKIGDFGLSTIIKNRERRYTTCGTPNYIAPEILNQTGHGFEVDVWALGIMIYALLVGKPPFQCQTVDQTYKKIRYGNFQFPKSIPISSQVKSLIKMLLDPNPKTRISLVSIKNHEWIVNQKIPLTMPSYTISIPPENSFLKQYTNQRHIKLAIYPRKISAVTGLPQDHCSSNADLKLKKNHRVMSCDKNLLKMSVNNKSISSNCSQLNKGVIFNSKMKIQIRSGSNRMKRIESHHNMISQNSPDIFKTAPLQKKSSAQPQKMNYEQDSNEIICYFDMSVKYGIGYLLSNGNFGVAFNDQTSLTALQTGYIYYDGTSKKIIELSSFLKKKGDIMRLCEQKLSSYRQKNILIAFQSDIFVKKWTRHQDALVMKLTNGIFQFFWGGDVLSVRGVKWVRWRISGEQGENAFSSSNFSPAVEHRMAQVRQFFQKESQKRKKKQKI